jgi:hypothetical protein
VLLRHKVAMTRVAPKMASRGGGDVKMYEVDKWLYKKTCNKRIQSRHQRCAIRPSRGTFAVPTGTGSPYRRLLPLDTTSCKRCLSHRLPVLRSSRACHPARHHFLSLPFRVGRYHFQLRRSATVQNATRLHISLSLPTRRCPVFSTTISPN